MARPTSRADVANFATRAGFREWLEAHHGTADELFVGYYRKGAGKTGMTYAESVEEALCFGWIDGITYRIDSEVYAIRMTPRRKGSSWSAPNIGKVSELRKAGRMHPAGTRAFEQRDTRREMPYLRDHPLRQHLPPTLEARIEANPKAWAYWQAQHPSYRRQVAFWIQSAKRDATRERRLASLIEDSAAGLPVRPMRASSQPKDR